MLENRPSFTVLISKQSSVVIETPEYNWFTYCINVNIKYRQKVSIKWHDLMVEAL